MSDDKRYRDDHAPQPPAYREMPLPPHDLFKIDHDAPHVSHHRPAGPIVLLIEAVRAYITRRDAGADAMERLHLGDQMRDLLKLVDAAERRANAVSTSEPHTVCLTCGGHRWVGVHFGGLTHSEPYVKPCPTCNSNSKRGSA